ncbi:hypothetical protein ACWOEF_02935 [Enterococcus crotali]
MIHHFHRMSLVIHMLVLIVIHLNSFFLYSSFMCITGLPFSIVLRIPKLFISSITQHLFFKK